MANAGDIANVIAALKALFPNYSPDIIRADGKPGKTPEMLLAILGDLDRDTLQAATLSLASEPGRAFAPSAGEIRGEALKLRAIAAGIPEAWRAYEEVVNMPADMKRRELVTENQQNFINIYNREFSHPIVESVARMIGWPDTFPTDMPGVDRAQFVKAYDAEVSRTMQDAGRLPLVTQYIENKRAQLEGKSPALIQNITKRLETK
jgi:hypothetical protein